MGGGLAFAAASLAVHIDLKIQAETGDLKGEEASLKIKSANKPCKDHTYTVSAGTEGSKKTISIKEEGQKDKKEDKKEQSND